MARPKRGMVEKFVRSQIHKEIKGVPKVARRTSVAKTLRTVSSPTKIIGTKKLMSRAAKGGALGLKGAAIGAGIGAGLAGYGVYRAVKAIRARKQSKGKKK